MHRTLIVRAQKPHGDARVLVSNRAIRHCDADSRTDAAAGGITPPRRVLPRITLPGPVLIQALVVSIVLLLASPASTPSLGASYVVPSDDVLIGKADVIVRGRVLDVTSIEMPVGGISTDITLAVTRILKGSTGESTIVVRQPGGQVGERIETYPGIGTFAKDEELLLMLEASGSQPFRVTDFALGRFLVMETSTGTEFLRRDGLADAFVLGSSGGVSGTDIDPDRDASAFESYITGIAHGVAVTPDYVLPSQTAANDYIAEFKFLCPPSNPQCTPARRTEFESNIDVTYKDNAIGDNGTMCGADHCHEAVADGMVKWNSAPGTRIALRYGGTDNTVGSTCLNALNDRISFNDPCNDILNLNGCSGTLALGGFSATTQSGGQPSCPAKGNPAFYKITASKIMVNNGVGNCLNKCDYTEMIAHETGHTLGAGHSDVGSALMAPSLQGGSCGLLRQDDIDFAQCVYPGGPPSCDLSASRTWVGPPPASVTFAPGISSGIPPYTFDYSFGDGTSSTAHAPSHAYAQPGTFTASVTVTDSNSGTCSDTLDIAVNLCKSAFIKSVSAVYASGTWKAPVVGKGFKSGARVEIDSGSGFVMAPSTRFRSSVKVVGRDVEAIWPSGITVLIRVVSPNGCPSNVLDATR